MNCRTRAVSILFTGTLVKTSECGQRITEAFDLLFAGCNFNFVDSDRSVTDVISNPVIRDCPVPNGTGR